MESHGLYGRMRNAKYFLRSEDVTTPSYSNESTTKTSAEGGGGETILTFVSPTRFIDALFRKWRAICRRNVSDLVAALHHAWLRPCYSPLARFLLFFFSSLPRRHSARVSPLTHAFPDCAELNAAILCGESRPRNAPYNVGKFMLIFRIVGCRVYTRYPLIFHETKVEKKKTLPVATYRGDDESAMKFHYRGMFTKRSNILISRSLEIMFPVP